MLIYASFPITGYEEKPKWVLSIRNSLQPCEMLYDPSLPIQSQFSQESFIRHLEMTVPQEVISSLFKNRSEGFPLWLSSPISDHIVKEALASCDSESEADFIFREIYVILRSNILLADLSNPSFGGVSSSILFARLLSIPIIGLTYRFHVSPWMFQELSAMVFARKIPEILSIARAMARRTS